MDTPSHFAFVDSRTPLSKRGAPKGSVTKSLIRSHAMQQVWEQRRLQRARDRGENGFEIVLENEKLEGLATTSLERRHSKSNVRGRKSDSKGCKRNASRQNGSLNIPAVAVVSKEPKAPAGAVNSLLKVSGETSRKSNGLSDTPDLKWAANLDRSHSTTQSSALTSLSPGILGMSLVDPFDSCAFSLGVKESQYLNHYFQALSWRFTMPKKTWLRYAIHDPGLLHGVLAIAAAHHSYATAQGLSNDAIYHHARTINHVQNCLSDPLLRFSDGVIGAIGRMVICHLIFGDRANFVTHMKALERSIEARGGLENLGMVGQLKYIVTSCVAGAATTVTTWWQDVPLQLRYPYGLLDYPAVDEIPNPEPHDPEWGLGFRELNRIGFMSDALLDIGEAIIALNSVLNSRRKWDESQQRLFGEQCNKLSLRLAYLRDIEANTCHERTPLYHMRECVRLVSHFYVSAFQRDMPLLSNISLHTLQMLKDTLRLTNPEACWGGGELGETLLWVLVITGAGCARPQERDCVGTQLQKTAMRLGVTEWSEVKRICRKFLYLDSTLERRTWPLWKDYRTSLAGRYAPFADVGTRLTSTASSDLAVAAH